MKLFKRKEETISFGEFMSGTHGAERLSLNHTHVSRPLYGFIGITPAQFFNMSPEMTGAYVLVIGAGVIFIALAALERRFFESDSALTPIVDGIAGALNILCPVGLLGIFLYFITTL